MIGHFEQRSPQRPARRAPPRSLAGSASAFTLVEVVVVALILGILAAVAVPAVINRAEQSKSRSMYYQAIAIERAASQYFAQYGKWPGTAYWGSTSLFDPFIHPMAFHPSQVESNQAWGWIWLAPWNTYKALLYSYSTVPPTSLWQRIDSEFDDGNLRTGSIIVYQTNYLFFIVDK